MATMMCDQELPVIYETAAPETLHTETLFRDVIPQQIWRGSAWLTYQTMLRKGTG